MRWYWHRYRSLSVLQRWALWHALWLLPWVRMSLRFRGLDATLRQVRTSRHWVVPADGLEQAGVQAREMWVALGLVSGHLWGRTTCLHRALAQLWLMHRRGIPGSLHIGVDLVEGQLDAHAWVECLGASVESDGMPEKKHSLIWCDKFTLSE
jgi:hypothetical protein